MTILCWRPVILSHRLNKDFRSTANDLKPILDPRPVIKTFTHNFIKDRELKVSDIDLKE